jgi:hypothetical protein
MNAAPFAARSLKAALPLVSAPAVIDAALLLVLRQL